MVKISKEDFSRLAGDNDGTRFPGEPAMTILSLGAGVQSSTMALMAEEGAFGKKPDAAIFADTGWEPKPVIEHLKWLQTKLSFPVHICSKGNIREDIIKAMGPEGSRFASAPFFTKNPDSNKKGMLRRQCTREYKITPLTKKMRELMGILPRKRFPKDKWIEVWIGISTDEIQRIKPSRERWQKNRWPLIEMDMNRNQCLDWYKTREQYKVPAKSACIGCPFHDDAFWLDMKRNRPEEFKDACEIDEVIRKGNDKVKDQLFMHRSCVPLKDAKFKGEEELDMFQMECEGMCGL
jgi:hypothetical protein